MQQIMIAGNTGKDAEHKTTQSGQELCAFSVAVNSGYGDNKVTTWFDVSRWGKGADGLARVLRKGSKVAVTGELSTREHNGKAYLQVRADKVTILDTPGDGSRGAPADTGDTGKGNTADDLDDDIPFIRGDGIW